MRYRASMAFCVAEVWLLAACTGYRAQPLAGARAPLSPLETRTIDVPSAQGLNRVVLKVDPFDGLDENEVAALAVLRSPELRVARAVAKVAHAQAFSAGLLAEPQLGFSRDFTLASTPDVTSAFAISIAQDLGALVTAAAKRRVRTALEHRADLELLWQELQVMARARQLFTQSLALQQSVALLREQQAIATQRGDALATALEKRWIGAAAAEVGLASQSSIDTLLAEALRQQTEVQLNLRTLIGLAPDAPMQLNAAPRRAPFQREAIDAAKRNLALRRADLLALQQGYVAQESQLRASVLSQFPPLTFSVARARDTAGIRTRGYGVSLALPLFGGARAAVAIQLADRERLRAEYDARLSSTTNDIDLAAESLRLIESRIPSLEHAVGQLQSAASNAALAASSRDIDQLTYADLVDAYVGKRVELLAAEQTRADLQTSLAALLAVDPQQLTAVAAAGSP